MIVDVYIINHGASGGRKLKTKGDRYPNERPFGRLSKPFIYKNPESNIIDFGLKDQVPCSILLTSLGWGMGVTS